MNTKDIRRAAFNRRVRRNIYNLTKIIMHMKVKPERRLVRLRDKMNRYISFNNFMKSDLDDTCWDD